MVIDAANWRCVLYCTTGGGVDFMQEGGVGA